MRLRRTVRFTLESAFPDVNLHETVTDWFLAGRSRPPALVRENRQDQPPIRHPVGRRGRGKNAEI